MDFWQKYDIILGVMNIGLGIYLKRNIGILSPISILVGVMLLMMGIWKNDS
jgi:hypothetical membrane protein